MSARGNASWPTTARRALSTARDAQPAVAPQVRCACIISSAPTLR
jgi:hypothetical protein